MAGFAVISGKAGTEEVKTMLGKIKHRGPYAEGVSDKGKVVMAQNYLRADNVPSDSVVPFSDLLFIGSKRRKSQMC